MSLPARPAFRPARIVVSGMILLALAGCSRKSGEAVVLEKEHIAAAENSRNTFGGTGQFNHFTNPGTRVRGQR